MLVTFQTKSYANITMFESIADQLLHHMAHSGTIPGAIAPEDLPSALLSLKDYLNNITDINEFPSDDDEEQISLNTRAIPLIELLEAAIQNNEHVLWHRE